MKRQFNGPGIRRSIATATPTVIAMIITTLMGTVASAETASITVNLSGLRSQKGNVMVCLWTKEKQDFPFCSSASAYQSTTLKANSSSLVATFPDVPAGEYAVSAFHDENGDGELNKNWMGMPKEGIAAINLDPKKNQGRRERPSFDKAKFQLKSATNLSASFMYR